jgi:hypothetical protein
MTITPTSLPSLPSKMARHGTCPFSIIPVTKIGEVEFSRRN